jgi:hypothetical protein
MSHALSAQRVLIPIREAYGHEVHLRPNARGAMNADVNESYFAVTLTPIIIRREELRDRRAFWNCAMAVRRLTGGG